MKDITEDEVNKIQTIKITIFKKSDFSYLVIYQAISSSSEETERARRLKFGMYNVTSIFRSGELNDGFFNTVGHSFVRYHCIQPTETRSILQRKQIPLRDR